MITKPSLKTIPQNNPLSEAENARAKRLFLEGFIYIYMVGKSVYAANPNTGRLRLIQGTDFKNLVRPINLKLMFEEQEVTEE